MDTYYITRIEEPDFGCEGRPEGQEIKDKVFLKEEITKEEVYSDFNLMQEKCKRMDTLRTELDAALEEMILLEEELG